MVGLRRVFFGMDLIPFVASSSSKALSPALIIIVEKSNHSKAMQSSYRLNASDLDEQFLDALKLLFKDQEIEIVVTAIDETDYLMKSDSNRQRLLQSVQNIENRENLVEVRLQELE